MAESSSLESRVRRMIVPVGDFSGKTPLVLAVLGLVAAFSLSMIGRETVTDAPALESEVQLRLTADPFPGEH